MDDLGGWEPTGRERDLLLRLIDGLEKRIDALRADVNVLMGRETPDADARVRPFGIGLTTWIALLTGFGALLAGIGAVLGASK
jgi:hypothetical protein